MPMHQIPVTYFWDAIDEFELQDYDIYVVVGQTQNDRHMTEKQYEKSVIRGSLQSQQGFKKSKDKAGSTVSATFRFFCKSKYQINLDDIIMLSDGTLLICTSIDEPYDEWGVRAATLEMTQLYMQRDLQKYLKTLSGEDPV